MSKSVVGKSKFKMNGGPKFNKKGQVIFRNEVPNALSMSDFKQKLQEYLGVKKWSDFCGQFLPEYDHRGNVKKESIAKMVDYLKNNSYFSLQEQTKADSFAMELKTHC